MTITKHNNGYVLNKAIYLSPEGDIDSKYITLAYMKGSDMHYGNHDTMFIDYPGEYDLKGILFEVTAGKGGELNYLINDGNKTYAFVQTEDALNDEDFNPQVWLFTNPHIAKMVDKMELEGEKIDLTTIA